MQRLSQFKGWGGGGPPYPNIHSMAVTVDTFFEKMADGSHGMAEE